MLAKYMNTIPFLSLYKNQEFTPVLFLLPNLSTLSPPANYPATKHRAPKPTGTSPNQTPQTDPIQSDLASPRPLPTQIPRVTYDEPKHQTDTHLGPRSDD